MIYLLYLFSGLMSFLVDILCLFPFNWIVAAFAGRDGNLPKRLYWFQTFDATLDEGMLARQRELATGVGGTTWKAFNPTPTNWFQTYLNRALWLLRNSAYGFDYYLFGMKWVPTDWRLVRYTDTPALTLFVAVAPKGFNVYAFGRFGELKIGWKAWNLYNTQTGAFGDAWGTGGSIPIAFTFNPFSRKDPAVAIN